MVGETSCNTILGTLSGSLLGCRCTRTKAKSGPDRKDGKVRIQPCGKNCRKVHWCELRMYVRTSVPLFRNRWSILRLRACTDFSSFTLCVMVFPIFIERTAVYRHAQVQ
ncbi:hypothetical protein RvY_08287-2 [Ramazzottius varieornatus]|uniref:Uncharacterized protein n=1 Tax=Ramazzottius varieornatus TaxID=947166 RepID=A0A1D1V7N5_RAMVA|nr:hypothetical protein RvY_08287-2 [Ramazzottius varieornatus]